MFFKWKKEPKVPATAATAVSTEPAAASAAGGEISTEIVAVITAAIAAMMDSGSTGSNGFIVRKISRIHGEKLSWSNAGLMECIDSRRF